MPVQCQFKSASSYRINGSYANDPKLARNPGEAEVYIRPQDANCSASGTVPHYLGQWQRQHETDRNFRRKISARGVCVLQGQVAQAGTGTKERERAARGTKSGHGRAHQRSQYAGDGQSLAVQQVFQREHHRPLPEIAERGVIGEIGVLSVGRVP